jgi:lipopolysaccharide transport system ATP-binding protein
VNAALRAEALTKLYRLRRPPGLGGPRRIDKLALDAVSFDAQAGEVLGIIGRNGAGKTTLLRVLARITLPTRGRASIRGRVAALLEVGTGMHPEMSGRENIFLNGALLGMPRPEIAGRLDQIVDFAGIGAYLDTPIKRYSSGMKVRLAFAVAAHLAADVLLVDEVLAVGDAEFQARCLGALRGGRSSGRTTLFVSHNLAAVEHLCGRALWLDDGRLALAGPAPVVVQAYLRQIGERLGAGAEYRAEAGTAGVVRVARAVLRGTCGPAVRMGEDLLVDVELEAARAVRGFQLQLLFSTAEGSAIAACSNADYRAEWDLAPGSYRARVRLDQLRLLPRRYLLSLRTMTDWGKQVFEELPAALDFEVLAKDVLGSGVELRPDRGVTWLPARFELEPLPAAGVPASSRSDIMPAARGASTGSGLGGTA